MRTATPLTAKEKRYLDLYDQKFSEPAVRGYTRVAVLTFAVSTALVWWLRTRKFDIEGVAPEGVAPEGRGSVIGAALLAALLVTGGVLLIRWVTRFHMGTMQTQYRARYVAAGAEGEAAPPPPSVG